MTVSKRDHHAQNLVIEGDIAQALSQNNLVHELDPSDYPHLIVKVPDLDKALQAEVGVEIEREDDGSITLSVLLYDIPTEPVSYDLRLLPQDAGELRFLRNFTEKAQFRMHPCQETKEGWRVGPLQTFRLPANVLLRLKHYSISWPREELDPPRSEQEETESEPTDSDRPAPATARSPDPRDTVIRKLKEQVHALRAQVQERDKRIIDLEDELHELRSKGRAYRLSGEKKPWWKPFS